jgi:hypothetical protein
MPTKERIHQLVDLWPDGDDRLEAAERVLEPNGNGGGSSDSNGLVQLEGLVNPIDDPWKDVVPMQGDVSDLVSLTVDITDEQREQQRAHWRKARDELIAEGAEPGKYIGQLEAEADLEAQAVSSPE